MDVLEQFVIPKTRKERDEMDLEVLQVPASIDKFFDLVEECDYRIEYYNGEIISFMGQASISHETVVANVIHYFNNYYILLDEYRVLSSNMLIYSDECETAFNADISVLKGHADLVSRKNNRKSISTYKNPEIIVEVLSDSTRDFDFGAKLNCYKTIPTLKQIIFIDQSRVHISSYIRTSDPNEWINHDYFSIEESLKMIDFEIKIEDIYRKIPVLKKN